MNNKTYRENARRFPKCAKEIKEYVSNDGKTTVLVDKNGQVCGGTFMATHKGRPVILEGRELLSPVTEQVWDEDRKKNISVFSYYETLIETIKVNK